METLVYTTPNGSKLFGNQWIISDSTFILLLITGMAEHSSRYDDFARYINSIGGSVYCIDHYGHGNNVPLGVLPSGFFFKEIDEFHDFISKINSERKPFYVFGHSMGSFMVQAFLEIYPNDFTKAIICGTNGPRNDLFIANALASILVNERNRDKGSKLFYSLSLGAYEKVAKKGESKNARLSYDTKNVELYDEDPLSGFKCSKGFYKDFFRGLSFIQKKGNLEKISKRVKILIIAGEDDPVGNFSKGPRKLYSTYMKIGLDIRLVIFGAMRHEILNEADKKNVYLTIGEFIEE
jgi:alpha-beta hydrolase superfamily lysophospholipase